MNLKKFVQNDWQIVLQDEFEKPYFKSIENELEDLYKTKIIFPSQDLIFNALNLTAFKSTKVVILGQDPYHGLGQAHGLSFSVTKNQKIPPSLKNIFTELRNDISEFEIPLNGDLTPWAKQGILLLNSVLTVEQGIPASHKKLGWQFFTDTVIQLLSNSKDNLIFMLWGNYGIEKEKLINASKHLILKAAHPSPLAGGKFFGCKHFSKANEFLAENNLKAIDWRLESENTFLFQ